MKSPRTSKIDNVKRWLTEFSYTSNMIYLKDDAGWVKDVNGWEYRFKVEFYTHLYSYSILAIDKADQRSYLGCLSHCRYPRVGETWRRGSDLPDGPLNRETWEKIKDSIIAHELEVPTPKETTQASVFEVLSKALKGAFIAMHMHQVDTGQGWQLPKFVIESEELPEGLVTQIVDHLSVVMTQVPVKMLPEFLVAKDEWVRLAASKVLEGR